MKQNFEECLAHVLKHEGGYVDHPKDPGGATNLGCTKKVWEEWVGHEVTKDDIKVDSNAILTGKCKIIIDFNIYLSMCRS